MHCNFRRARIKESLQIFVTWMTQCKSVLEVNGT